jgi:uncharacterized protein (TIGR03437 family)
MFKYASHIGTPIFLVFALTPCFAHSYGPAPRVTGGPGDSAKACTQCHTTSALNSGPGSVKIVLTSGPVYIPGVKQRVTVQVADPAQQRWGFEFSARLNSDLESTQAGDITSIDNLTQVICEDAGPKPCASGPSFITHTSAGTRNGLKGGAAFQFDWTPPATDVGPVTLYAAGNASNGDGTPNGDLIYTTSVQLKPANPAAPSITAGDVVSSATYAAGPTAANSWITIYGSNLGVTTRAWGDTDLTNGGLPYSLDGVSVMLTAFGAPRLAYVGYVSPTQVNFLIPSDMSSTTAQVQVRNPAGISKQVPLTVQANAPQLFSVDGKYVLGAHTNGALLGKSGLLASAPTTPAAAGETVVLYGTGLGRTNPALITAQLPTQAASLATPPQVTIGGAPATVVSAGVIPGNPGVYQISIQIPANMAAGDQPVVVQTGGVSSASTLLTVQ